MRTCDRCQHELHWDDATCPECGAAIPERGVRSPQEQAEDRWQGISFVLGLLFRPALAVLISAISYVVGKSVGVLWLAVIAWAIIGLVVFIVYRTRSARRTKQWSRSRERTRDHEELYAQFLKEHPALESLLPKERHEAFRKWVASRG